MLIGKSPKAALRSPGRNASYYKGPKNGQYSLTDSLKVLHANMVKAGFPADYRFK